MRRIRWIGLIGCFGLTGCAGWTWTSTFAPIPRLRGHAYDMPAPPPVMSAAPAIESSPAKGAPLPFTIDSPLMDPTPPPAPTPAAKDQPRISLAEPTEDPFLGQEEADSKTEVRIDSAWTVPDRPWPGSPPPAPLETKLETSNP